MKGVWRVYGGCGGEGEGRGEGGRGRRGEYNIY